MAAYYNELDPFAAAWLRELIKAGHIAPGEVDERDIREVQADDLRGFTQCHLFGGIGVWSYALKQAGWPDDTPVWTGSCPCQSFSASGKRGGFGDPRHLWPAWFRLIRECRPHTVFGEQVASKDGLAWLDVVSSDLEGAGYAIGTADLCAAGFGAPHVRQRLYFVADAVNHRTRRFAPSKSDSNEPQDGISRTDGTVGRMADTERDGGRADLAGREPQTREVDRRDCEAGELANPEYSGCRGRGPSEAGSEPRTVDRPERLRATGGMVVPSGNGRREGRAESGGEQGRSDATQPSGNGSRMGYSEGQRLQDSPESEGRDNTRGTSLTSGFWRDAEWLWCRDGKYRPVEPSTFPLAHGTANRVGRLRGYGNALCAPVAEAFIRAYLEKNG